MADAVCRCLEAAGLKCWIAPRDIPPGAEWAAAIMTGIAGSRLVVLLFSENADQSPHVVREVLHAEEKRLPVLPVYIEDALPTGSRAYCLLGLQWFDAWPAPFEPHLDRLPRTCGASCPVPPARRSCWSRCLIRRPWCLWTPRGAKPLPGGSPRAWSRWRVVWLKPPRRGRPRSRSCARSWRSTSRTGMIAMPSCNGATPTRVRPSTIRRRTFRILPAASGRDQ